ncbi:transcription factor UNE10-like isoform X2 [Salvia splendens]|uniref:transcription factor UNE10-like isoform X2 n=1 Tax=Salvia splendens TaxID=180675 RepID=UPI001C26CB37|nr:transcription factor UNE10-like isoform X2 [Salvia splendens]
MNQCVPSWDLDDCSKIKYQSNSPQDVPSLDYEVAELTWENGQLAMHGLGVPRVVGKQSASASPTTWDKPRAGGTLESIVNQAAFYPSAADAKHLKPWFESHCAMANPGPTGSVTATMDGLVPCAKTVHGHERQEHPAGCSTRVGSCAAPLDVVRESVQTFGGAGLTSTSTSSLENTISGQEYTKTSADDRDSVSLHSRSRASDRNGEEEEEEEGRRRDDGKSSVCTKRSRAAAIHNQSERKRRDKINQRMKTLQKLVPNSSKNDKASMLDEVIEYLKQLQAQVNMMSRMNMPSMMLPLAMQQQQLQMSMMGCMGMGMSMGMGMGMGVMDMNTIPRPQPTAGFMPLPPATWNNGGGDCLPPPPMSDPLAALLACQSQAGSYVPTNATAVTWFKKLNW